jgi:cytochrome c-type biogenesis protein CcmH/NrfG
MAGSADLWDITAVMIPNRRLLVVFVLIGLVAGASVKASRLWAVAQADAEKTSIQERLDRVRADLFARAERIKEDIHELKAVLAFDPRSAEGHLLLGIAYRALGSAELMGEAVAELRQALALNPGFAPAHLYLAHIYLDLGRAGRAREEMWAALVQVPGNPQFLALLGETERQLKSGKGPGSDILRF